MSEELIQAVMAAISGVYPAIFRDGMGCNPDYIDSDELREMAIAAIEAVRSGDHQE